MQHSAIRKKNIYLFPNKAWTWLIQFFTDFLLVQLFINLLTWPLFLHWGLPITPLSIIGNLVFSPFLTIFLILSSLSVTLELLYIPNELCIYPLEWITKLWIWLIKCPTPGCMITCITPPFLFSLIAPCAATMIILSKIVRTKLQKIAALFVCYVFLIALFSYLPRPAEIEIPYGNHTVKVLQKDGILTLLDEGFSRRKSGINQWINYTLLPRLGATFGRQNIDVAIIKKNSPSTQLFAESLGQRARVKTITLAGAPFIGDEPVKTTPFFRAAPVVRSKNP